MCYLWDVPLYGTEHTKVHQHIAFGNQEVFDFSSAPDLFRSDLQKFSGCLVRCSIYLLKQSVELATLKADVGKTTIAWWHVPPDIVYERSLTDVSECYRAVSRSNGVKRVFLHGGRR